MLNTERLIQHVKAMLERATEATDIIRLTYLLMGLQNDYILELQRNHTASMRLIRGFKKEAS